MKRKKRDMQATARTLAYFVSRGGKPTTVKQAARNLRVPADRLHTRLTNLVKSGELLRVDRGVYVSSAASVPQPSRDSDKELLDMLLKDREHLDAQIEKVRSVIELKKQRSGK